jgi:hypothetical protein
MPKRALKKKPNNANLPPTADREQRPQEYSVPAAQSPSSREGDRQSKAEEKSPSHTDSKEEPATAGNRKRKDNQGAWTSLKEPVVPFREEVRAWTTRAVSCLMAQPYTV